MNREIIEKIYKIKKEKNAIVLAHCYQNVEIDEVADYIGDSLYLSRCAAKTSAEIIVFAGVYFMAETAKILSPNKKVLLPNKNAGCLMADMVNLSQIKEFKAQNSDIPVVCYVNSTAQVKAQSDICCTSANAVEIVKSLCAPKVLFVPDRNLGNYVASKLPNVEIICYDGFCPVHNQISSLDVLMAREKHKNALVLMHPECPHDALMHADFIGSTTAILDFVKKSDKNDFIIATEKGVVERLERDYQNKKFTLIKPSAICENMKLNKLNDILNCLENEEFEVVVDENIAKSAFLPIEKMINIKNVSV